MCTVGLGWERIPEKTQRSLEKSLVLGMDNLNDASLLSLSRISFKFGYKNPQILKAVVRGIVSLYGEKNAIKGEACLFASIVKLFGANMKRVDIPEIVLMSFYNGIEQLSPQFNAGDLADVIYG
jgi:hypothetical protein